METTRSNLVIAPDSQQSEHASRQGAMNGHMRPNDALPVFDSTTGSDGLPPGLQKVGGGRSPIWGNALQQVVESGAKDGSTQPRPGQQSLMKVN